MNDTASRWGETVLSGNVPLDNIANILANKLTAILSRDEPKDIFDILCISESYSFNWQQVYRKVFEKHITNESDIGMRLGTFPAELLSGQPWLKSPPDMEQMKNMLETITDDFLFARDNSLGASKTALIEARPGEPHPRPFS